MNEEWEPCFDSTLYEAEKIVRNAALKEESAGIAILAVVAALPFLAIGLFLFVGYWLLRLLRWLFGGA